ncbi:MAG: lamin tail domain-containing protein [Candidatus Azobacteroides sp.]|nr:lamin tail domain-containing protein [Candidatus Azobacteroides sp.]
MKKIVALFLILQSMTAFSQFSDNFSDGLFQNGPNSNRETNWTGDTAEFIVNESLQLQLNSSATHSPSQLRTHSYNAGSTSWEFYVRMDFNPTVSNYAKVYLVSDEEDLNGELNGLFVRIGYTNKNICLMRSQKGSTNQTLIQGTAKRLDYSSVALNIKATLDAKGTFNLYSQLEGESSFTLEGTCNIENVPASSWFGIVCTFTSSRSKLFFFDNFVIKDLDGDEPVPNPEPGYDLPKEGDILFSEVMANPGANNPEYVELYNSTDKTFRLQDCTFFYGTTSYKLPDKTIAPRSYFVLCKTSGVSWFAEGINVSGVTSFPTLANTGKLLVLENAQKELVSWFEYADAMYNDNAKKGGGWSLECIDLNNLSNMADNWSASMDSSGGTPGRANSIQSSHADTELPLIVSSSLLDNNTVEIAFSKPMNRNTLLNADLYSILDAAYTVTNLGINYPQANLVDVQLNQFPPKGELTELVVSGLQDLSGNDLAGTKSVLIGDAFEAQESDIVINEILFNPPTGGEEYVELYNRSNKILDLRYLSITSRRPSDGSLNKAYPLTQLPVFLYPGEYVVVTKSQDLVCGFFNCHGESLFIEPETMPAYANTSGCAVILNNITNEVVDQFFYNESMHSPGLASKKGAALEKIDINIPSSEASNWASASTQSGYGTPGYQNSQYARTTGIDISNDFSIRIEYPSVNNENYGIQYHLDKAGYNCRLFVYDPVGRLVDTIANNELLESQGVFYWNGNGKSHRRLSAGIYIIYMEVFDTIGNVHAFKTPIVMK